MTEFPVRVSARRDEAYGVFSLELTAVAGQLPSWEPGAHIDVAVGAAGVRQYSLCGDPADQLRWRIAILREPDGRGGSEYLYRTALLDSELRISFPRNNFELVERASYVFIAGGIGITPILPMVTAAQARGARWELYYGGRTLAHMAFTEEIGRYSQARLLPQDEHGLLPIADILAEHPDSAIYCCGPEPLLAAVETEGALSNSAVFVERFVPRPVLVAPRGTFEIQLAGSGRTFRIAADQSIADVLDAAGIGIITSCREGTCGSCETTVLAGEIDHRDSVLTAEEQACGNTMMLCVSRSRSDVLVLDL